MVLERNGQRLCTCFLFGEHFVLLIGADVTAASRLEPSASDHAESQPAEPVWIGEHIDLDDPPALDRRGHNRKWTPVGRPRDGASSPVHEDPTRRFAEATE